MASTSSVSSVTTLTLPQFSAHATLSAAPNSASLFQRVQGSKVFTLSQQGAVSNMPPLFLKLRIRPLEEEEKELSELAVSSSESAAATPALEEQKSDDETESLRPTVTAFFSIAKRIQGFLETYRSENNWNDPLSVQLWDWGYTTQKGTLELIEKGLTNADNDINEDEIESFAQECLQKVIAILRNPYGGVNTLLQDPVIDGEEVIERVAHQQAFLICRGKFPGTNRPMTTEPPSHAFAKEIIELLKTQYELPATENEAPIQFFLDSLPRKDTQTSSASAAAPTHYPQLNYRQLTTAEDSTLRIMAARFNQTANKIRSGRDFAPIHEAIIPGDEFLKTAITELQRVSAKTDAETKLSAQERDNAIQARIAQSNEIHERTNRRLIEQLTHTEGRFHLEMEQKQRAIEAQNAAHLSTLRIVAAQVDQLAVAQQQSMEALRTQTRNQIASVEIRHRTEVNSLENRITQDKEFFRQSISQMQQQHTSSIGALNGQISSLSGIITSLSSTIDTQSHTVTWQNQQLHDNRIKINDLRQEAQRATQRAQEAMSHGTHHGGIWNKPAKAIAGFFGW